MPEDPWANLDTPSLSQTVAARRVDASIPWGFFWARSADGNYMLVLRHADQATSTSGLPRLSGIDVSLFEGDQTGERVLAFRLLESSQGDIFYRLCQDIVEGAVGAASEKEAVEVALARTWRWHHLLRGGSDARLSEEEQKGLIGELLVLERYLLPWLRPAEAVTSWRGPLDAPKDFEVGGVSIEAKARRGGATPFITISSEHQLDESGVDALFLHVADLHRAPEDADGAFTVSEIAGRVRKGIAAEDNVAADLFGSLVAAAGFRWADDYSDWVWVEGQSRFYQVGPEFPRITSAEIRPGVAHLTYSVSLVSCEPYLIENEAVETAVQRRRDAS